jgi:predicted nucleic acid-binding protein
MNKSVILDTDIVIELLRKQNETVQILLELQDKGCEFYLCPVVVAEVYAGAFSREYLVIERFFSHCRQLTINDETGKIAGLYASQYRKAFHKISLEDYLIAACARQYQLCLWTRNKKHYPMQDIQLVEEFHV